MEYIFYYYWNLGSPAKAKAIRDRGELMGGGPRPIEGAVFVISEHAYIHRSLELLTIDHPWPFPEGNDA